MTDNRPVRVGRERTDEEYLTTQEVAKMTRTSKSLWDKMRWRGGGPPFCHIGSSVRYLRSDVDHFIRATRTQSTSTDTTEKSLVRDTVKGTDDMGECS